MAGPIRVLLVEDNPAEVRLLLEGLRELPSPGVNIDSVGRLADAVETIGHDLYDVILLDLNLPDSEGAETIRRMHEVSPAIPLIILTGISDEKTEMEAVRLGAQDFLVKGEASPRALIRTLRYAIDRRRIARRMERMVGFSTDILEAETRDQLLECAVKETRDLIGAEVGAAGLDIVEGRCRINALATSRPGGIGECSIDMGLFSGRGSIRMGAPELKRLLGPAGQIVERGLMGVTIVNRRGDTTGVLLVCDRTEGEFTAEDELLLRQIGSVVSLALQHLEARNEAQQSAREAQEKRCLVEQQKVALEAAVSELESFTYSVSHDLRTPLRSVGGFSKILMEEYRAKLDRTGIDYLNRIGAGARKMQLLIDDLLYLSRVSRFDLIRQPVDLTVVAVNAIEELRAAQPRRHIDVDIRRGIVAWADRRLVGIAIANLLGNAWKFTEKTTDAHIQFGETRIEGSKTYFVRDNGAGFDPRHAERLFQPFQRLHSEQEFAGTGIGLAIVQRIVRRHGGNIWAEGEPGKGAVFYFTLGE